MNAHYLGDHRPAPILRDMTPRDDRHGFLIRFGLVCFSVGVIMASIGFYLAGKV